MTFVWVLTGITALLLLVVVTGFNRLRRADLAAREAIGGIDVQLTRRAELVPRLVETVKAHAAHEQGVLGEVTRARTQVQRATEGDDVGSRAEADAGLERSLADLTAVAKNYPTLRADATFSELLRQLADVEGQVAFARQYYNDTVRRLNDLVATVPWMFLTGVARVHSRDFYEAPEGHREVPGAPF
ncbi:LemA family protein [Nocardioides malaquae]|uniref:LemA family protein n=1 Tax=Nocardioides malaquae TaxID=2773426 RepID=UPI0029D41B82|nr:LemA family protein [Nocardioides malaquae]